MKTSEALQLLAGLEWGAKPWAFGVYTHITVLENIETEETLLRAIKKLSGSDDVSFCMYIHNCSPLEIKELFEVAIDLALADEVCHER